MVIKGMRRPLVEVQDVSTYYPRRGSGRWLGRFRPGAPIRAVEGVTLEIDRGSIVGLVGESGSGKTTLGMAVAGLERPTRGRVLFEGTDIWGLARRQLLIHRRNSQMVFQDPRGSLSPRWRVSALLMEPYKIHHTPPTERYAVAELLDLVQLPAKVARSRPHELSGGQARRVGFARALALRPKLVVADEPTAGLDVSAVANLLNVMSDLRGELSLSYLLISHDMDAIGYLADVIAVMQGGHLVELGPAESVFGAPRHPHTRALMEARGAHA